jgi:2-polyprenyl-3-methyl-5-hydroxy-6-metoxy-1,4-benzoquinol methylase
MTDKPNITDLNRHVQEVWDANADWWDSTTGPEGNSFHRQLIAPATDRLLDLHQGEIVLDIACGNGQVSRHMAELGAQVVGFDFSSKFLERARAHTHRTPYADKIEYRKIDATDESQLLSLGEERFDAAVCTMALMDMADIEPLLRTLPRLLKSTGRFVFSVPHPCFNNTGIRKVAELVDWNGDLVTTYGVMIARYVSSGPTRAIGIKDQPQPTIVIDRTLSELFGSCFRAGLAMDGLEEPTFPAGLEGHRGMSWENFHETPPVLVARLRRSR